MRLKSIKLAGFKSFVDPTTVHFPTNMSAVVGPNGCGKSNIIDAVRWVMGESSAKNLRGESMTDVIFNGSSSRKPVGQASIELLFDNHDGSVGGEYASFSEISIRRKVTRDGDNSYYLNGAKCRRKDITDIFLGTGLGPRSYAIIEQGMISKLIEAKPEELRVFVEEAAGISRYKERRRDTENRIRRTRENLERLTDIREELQRQLQHLQRQARTAERYKELKARERELKAKLQAVQWRDLDNKAGASQQLVRELQVKLEAIISQRVAHETEIEKQRSTHIEISDRFNLVQAEFYRLGADIARDEQRIQSIRERDNQLRDDLRQVEASAEQVAVLLAQDEERLTIWRAELENLLPELELAQAAEEDSGSHLLQAEERMQTWQSQWDDFNHSAAKPRQQAEVQQSRIQHLEQATRRLAERIEKLGAEKTELLPAGDSEEIALLQEQLAEAELKREQLRQWVENAGVGIISLRETLEAELAGLDELRNIHQQQLGRQASLEALQQEAIEPGAAAGAWLAQHQLSSSQRLADIIGAEAGWEVAVETVLGAYLQATCVADLNHWLPELGSLSGISMALVETGAAVAAAPELVGQTPLSLKVTGQAPAGLLAGVYCVDDVAQAVRMRARLQPGQSLITPQGLWLGYGWVRVAGNEDASAGILRRQRDLDNLRITIEESAAKLQVQEQRRDALRQQLQTAESLRDTRQREDADIGNSITVLTAEASARQARREQTDSRHQQLAHELDEGREQLQQEQAAIREARGLLQESLDQMEVDTGRREELLRQRDEYRVLLDASRQSARQKKDGSHQLAMRHQGLSTQIESVAAGTRRLGEQTRQLQERRAALGEQRIENTSPVDALNADLKERLEQRLIVEERLAQERQLMQAAEFEMRAAERHRNEVELQVNATRSELEAARMELLSLETRRKTIADQIRESQYQLEEVLAEIDDSVPESQWQAELEQLSAQIARLGPINLAAIDEYQSQAERKHYLDTQNTDLVEAMDTLEAAIRKIDRETRARFKDTFDEINAGLRDLFPKFFGGGVAQLEMTGDDMLDTGIAIMAQPPGKKNSTIHLLSGGEKALTAIALVFAIFRLNPAPFCMLDEVDAPLDDANVGRYARLVKHMSEQVQFIYITHNKMSMEHADQLMGVTMTEPGCSRLVTVDIEEAAELAAS